ncbi:MAG: hypothetical protein ACRDZ4_01945 [Egibacteraceae bacterium]
MVGAAGLIVPFLLRRLERRDAVGERRRARDRAVMLKRVRNRWITGVLDRSLTEEARIRLGLTRRPEAIAPPAMLIRRPGQAAEPLPAGTRGVRRARRRAAHPRRARVGQDHRAARAGPRPDRGRRS